ncbi:monocarboxylate uptake permease MctP [Legionella genomosp. 1]|uniref:monocarboxylate uptake permease MctP n=1 Tax=Legionella genomosp. 1 TaxID=1093625 RepID=UPI001C9E66CB|nr:sodium:solute symporter family protein [Legionella genomosp. 1]
MSVSMLLIFLFFFLLVSLIGFMAVHWRKADMDSLHEWALAGRSFGTIISWFLVGGDLFTAYTFIAVPAFMYGAGALGFFAIPYTFIVYPLGFLILPKLWALSKQHGFITAADFVRARYDSSLLSLLMAITGVIATMPYIALQLAGIQIIIAALGFPTSGLAGEAPLIIAFIILSVYTYRSGVRAPALIAVVKDILIYIALIAAIIIIPAKLGGFSAIFAKIPTDKLLLKAPLEGNMNQFSAYLTLAFGSALALLLYPHSINVMLSAKSENAIRKNMILLALFSVLLGICALLGYMALAAGVEANPRFTAYFQQYKANFAVPALYLASFPDWFLGIAFAAFAIGGLVPAAIMSISAANLCTRNIYKEYTRASVSLKDEAKIAKIISLLIKAGALAFILFLPLDYIIQLQLLGGIWISQTFPSVIAGLYTRWFDYRALILGWIVGIISGTWGILWLNFKSSIYPLKIGDYIIPGYLSCYALILNFLIAALGTFLIKKMQLKPSDDLTTLMQE